MDLAFLRMCSNKTLADVVADAEAAEHPGDLPFTTKTGVKAKFVLRSFELDVGGEI